MYIKDKNSKNSAGTDEKVTN